MELATPWADPGSSQLSEGCGSVPALPWWLPLTPCKSLVSSRRARGPRRFMSRRWACLSWPEHFYFVCFYFCFNLRILSIISAALWLLSVQWLGLRCIVFSLVFSLLITRALRASGHLIDAILVPQGICQWAAYFYSLSFWTCLSLSLTHSSPQG